jgi:hypothetical protein
VTREQLLRTFEKRLDSGILDTKIQIYCGGLSREGREAAKEELLALELAKAGVYHPHWGHYLNRHGIYGRKRPVLTRPGGRVRIVA